jgi:hypothetical protein
MSINSMIEYMYIHLCHYNIFHKAQESKEIRTFADGTQVAHRYRECLYC